MRIVSEFGASMLERAILVALVWLAARALRLSPAVRCALWWCAGAKFVLGLAWTTPIPVPVLPAEVAPVHGAFPAAVQRSLASMPATSASPIGVRAVASGAREWTSFAAIAWTAVTVTGRPTLPVAEARILLTSLFLVGPVGAAGALIARAWYPRLGGLVMISSVAALAMLTRTILA